MSFRKPKIEPALHSTKRDAPFGILVQHRSKQVPSCRPCRESSPRQVETACPERWPSPEIRDQLPAETQLALFRVAQESLSNARKHARASDAQLSLEFGKNGLTLTIADDGNAHAPRHTSLGAAGELHSHRVVRTRETTSLRIAPLAFRRSLSSLDTFRKVN